MNNQVERNKIAAAISETAELYGKELSEGAIRRFVDNWDPWDSDRLETALKRWDRDPGHRGMPRVADLLSRIGELDPTKDHSRVKGYWMRKPDYRPTGMYLPQAKIDEACEALGIPLGKIKYGEIDL